MSVTLEKKENNQLELQISNEQLSAAEIDPQLITGYQSIYNRKIKRIFDCIFAVL